MLDHDYQAHWSLSLTLNRRRDKGIKALLNMMVDRFNFSFREALDHLEESREYLGTDGEYLLIILLYRLSLEYHFYLKLVKKPLLKSKEKGELVWF